MAQNRIVEYAFFFGLMAGVAFLVALMLQPFLSALALSAIIVTICYPLYRWMRARMPRQNETLAALLTTLVVVLVVFTPVVLLMSSLVNEALSIYSHTSVGGPTFEESVTALEAQIQTVLPGVTLNAADYIKQGASWVASNVGAFFAGTATTVFLFLISIIGSFYLFRDGERFTRMIVAVSPLPDEQDTLILRRLAVAIRSVATGSLLVAMIQGTLTGTGLWLFGFDRAVLWGTIAAVGALIPGVGTSIVFIPSVIFLIVTGSYGAAVGLAIWGMLAVGLIDNLLGPYLMSRGNPLHPFVTLLAVLGGVSLFGPIGFVVGPVMVSLLKVLLELYAMHIGDPAVAVSLGAAPDAHHEPEVRP